MAETRVVEDGRYTHLLDAQGVMVGSVWLGLRGTWQLSLHRSPRSRDEALRILEFVEGLTGEEDETR